MWIHTSKFKWQKAIFDGKIDFKQERRANILILSICVISPVELPREMTQGGRLNVLYLTNSSPRYLIIKEEINLYVEAAVYKMEVWELTLHLGYPISDHSELQSFAFLLYYLDITYKASLYILKEDRVWSVWTKRKKLIFLWKWGYTGMKRTALSCKTGNRKRQRKGQQKER